MSINKAVATSHTRRAAHDPARIFHDAQRLALLPGGARRWARRSRLAQTRSPEQRLPSKAIGRGSRTSPPLPLHLDDEPARLHPAAATGEWHGVPNWGSTPRVAALGDPGPRAVQRRLHARRRRPLQRAGYFRSLVPRACRRSILRLIVPLEILSPFLRLISLSVRLYANMLAGHMLILFDRPAFILADRRTWPSSVAPRSAIAFYSSSRHRRPSRRSSSPP